ITVTLGIWDHIYRGGVQTGGAEWVKEFRGRPIPDSVVGVTTENINAYTLASVKELLARVPAVDGLQFRVHEESGLAHEGMEGFWHAIFARLCPFFHRYAGGAKAESKASWNGRESFEKAASNPWLAKTQSTHSQRLTAVMASEKVVSALPGHP